MSRLLKELFKKLTQSTSENARVRMIGKDQFGNTYYEETIGESRGMRKTKRSFEPANLTRYDSPVPPEWNAWLNYRKEKPPTEQQIDTNMFETAVRREKATEIAKKFAKPEEVKKKPNTTKWQKFPNRYQND